MDKIKRFILDNKFLAPIAITMKSLLCEIQLSIRTRNIIKKSARSGKPRIFYIGVPAHNNLGDLAQGVCIRRWLKKHYPEHTVVEIETNALVNTHFSLLRLLKARYKCDDFVVFQSGYTTTDLGGYADEMHRAVMKILPKAKMLMMPQTIFFRSERNKKRTSEIYNAMKHMLYLARDEVSYQSALKMFPDISVKLYPDIVTTMIGTKHYSYCRNGIMMCCRDDEEKFYSDEELAVLAEKCKKFGSVERTDTTKSKNRKDVIRRAETYIEKEINKYAHYKLMITDRYHGTILSLVAGTPVIIIKTTDHKVTTGAMWFKGVYDDYVYLAEDLDDAYRLADHVYHKNLNYKLSPYFEKEYYDKLPKLFEETMR